MQLVRNPIGRRQPRRGLLENLVRQNLNRSDDRQVDVWLGAGDTEASAIMSANTAACAMLGSGVTDAMQCGVLAPSRLRCQER